MRFKKAKRQVLALILAMVLAVAQFALPVSAAMYDAAAVTNAGYVADAGYTSPAATDAVMDAFAGYIPPMASNITLPGGDIVTLTARSGAESTATFTLDGTATGPITYNRRGLPAWLELTVNDTNGTLEVSIITADAPTNRVISHWYVDILRDNYTIEVTIGANLPDITGAPIVVTTQAELEQAIADAGNTPTTIEIPGTITLTSTINIPAGANITFTGGGTLDGGGAVGVLDVQNGGELTIDGITISGGGGASGRGIRVRGGGNLTMHSGYITNNSSSGAGGGVIIDEGGTFTMYGGTISDNTALVGGGVRADGTFIMHDGLIYSNTSTSAAGMSNGGGGVSVGGSSGLFIMHGGRIENNATPSAHGMSGGVIVSSFGEFIMEGGIITGNTPNAIRVHGDDATFTHNGGIIEGGVHGATALPTPAAPDDFTLSYEETDPGVEFTVTIPETAGAEYSFDGGTTWSAVRTITAQPGDIITGYKRMYAVAGVSLASAATYASITVPAFGTQPPPPPQQVETPTATPNGGTFTDNVSVTLETTTAGAEIFFTTDGTAPTSSSTLFDTPIVLTETTTIRAIAIATGMENSEVLEITFTRQAPTNGGQQPPQGGGPTGPPPGWQPPTGGGGGSNVIPAPPVTPPVTDTPPPATTDPTPPIAPDPVPPPYDIDTTMGAIVNAPAGVSVIVPPAVEGLGANVIVNVTTQPTGFGAGFGGMGVGLSVTADNALTTALPARIIVNIPLDGISTATNHHRIVAVATDGTILGGNFNRASGLFTLETDFAGDFTIRYTPSLIRLLVQMDSFLIVDLADNAPVQTMDVLPTVVSGRTLLPARFIAQALGGTASWNSQTRQSTISVFGNAVTLREGEIAPGMDVPVQVINGRTMVPARFISETFGAIVRWDSATQSFEIIF